MTASQARQSTYASHSLRLFMLAAPAVVACIGKGDGIAFIVMLILALVCATSTGAAWRKASPGDPVDRIVLQLTRGLLLYCAASAAIDVYHGEPAGSFERYLVWLSVPFIIGGISHCNPFPDEFWRGLAFGSIAAFLLALYAYGVQAVYRPALGMNNPIFLGNFCSLLGFGCVVGLLFDNRRLATRWRVFLALGAVCGLGVSLLTSKTGIVALPVGVIALWILHDGPKPRHVKPVIYLTLLSMIILSALPGSPVRRQIEEFHRDASHWLTTDTREVSGDLSGSVGGRLEQWKFAILAFREAPLLGIDSEGYVAAKARLVEQGAVSSMILDPTYVSVHNEVLDHLLRRGVAGLAALLVFYGALLRFFVSLLHRPDGSRDPYAVFGLLISLMLIIFGMTNPQLIFSDSRHSLALLIGLSGAGALASRRQASMAARHAPDRKATSVV